MPKITSKGMESSCQEGGTDRKLETLTSELPPTRETTKGKPKEGREGGPSRKCSKKMAFAMEKWLQEARKDNQKPGGPHRANKEMTEKGDTEGEKKGEN